MWEELAARADWAIAGPENCNHAPVVTPEKSDLTCKAGNSVTMKATAKDPDGNKLSYKWFVQNESCTYMDGKAENLALDASSDLSASFTVPADAKAGDLFVVTLEVQDCGVERPMTRFAQYVITAE